MVRVGLQLYTIRSVDGSLTEHLHLASELGYAGVEFAGLDLPPVDVVAETLAATDLDAIAAHVGLDEIETSTDAVVDTCETLGIDRLVVPSYDPDAFETRAGVETAADRLETAANQLTPSGIDLHYHNHSFEFTELNGEIALDLLMERVADLRLELDVGLTTYAGVDPVPFIERYSDRLDLVHVTDTIPGNHDRRHADLGTGSVDLQGCVDAAVQANTDWLLFEHGLTEDPRRSASRGRDVIDELLSA